MTDIEAYRIIGEQAEELSKDPNVQKEMIKRARVEGKDAAEKWLYKLAIVTLIGTN